MFKPLARPVSTASPRGAGFADTQFLHAADDADYGGFAPTQLCGEDEAARVPAPPSSAWQAALASRATLARVATPPGRRLPPAAEEPAMPASWITSVPPGIARRPATPESRAHEAANRARALIAAQRRAEADAPPLARGRRLPAGLRGLLPLFVGVAVTMALISAVLPLFDRP